MNGRVLFSSFLVVVCLATLWGVCGQRSELAGLRAEHAQLQAQLAVSADSPAALAAEPAGAGTASPQPALVLTPELLRLRNEVTRLTERRQALAGVRAENERLRAQLASRGTNGPGGFQLLTAYVRRSEARLVGYTRPDDTLQSLLWAVQNRDLTNFLQAFTPEGAEQLRAQAGESPQSIEDFWSKSVGLVGMRIVSWEQDASDGSITVQVEVVPDESGPRPTLRQISGQWKIAGGF